MPISDVILGAFKQDHRGEMRPDDYLVPLRRKTLERILTENILPFWYAGVIDRQDGGYRLNHDLEGRWCGRGAKSIVTQARALWFFSRLVNSRFASRDVFEAAGNGYEFLRNRMWDRDFGGFFWEVDSEGKRVIRPDKHLYGQAFGLYALVEYASASNDASAVELARDLFKLLERHAHDSQHGGYVECFSREWSRLPSDRRSYLKMAANIRSMDTHLHLMEAITTFFSFTSHSVARESLTELILVLSSTVVRKRSGACTDHHQTGRDRRVCYGHDLENITLLIEACNAAGISNCLLLDFYRALFAYALRYGFDRKQGGFFYTGALERRADRLEKLWWVQAEGMLAALQMYCLTQETIYWDCFTRTLEWVVGCQVDWKHGDWHDCIRRDGTVLGDKAGAWKGPYHNGRAVIRCIELLDGFEICQPDDPVQSAPAARESFYPGL